MTDKSATNLTAATPAAGDTVYIVQGGNSRRATAGGIADTLSDGVVSTVKIADDAVSNAKLANAAAYTLKGNATAVSDNPTDIAPASLTEKTTLAEADNFIIADSEDSNSLKRVLKSNVSQATAVTAANTFGTDSVLIKSDGTGRGVQFTEIAVTDTGDVTMVGTLNVNPTIAGHRAWNSSQQFSAGDTGPIIYNQIAVNHYAAPSVDTRAMGLYMQFNTGRNTQTGGAFGAFFNVNNDTGATSNGDYMAVVGQTTCAATNDGTGEHYGGNLVGTVSANGVTPAVHGLELDLRIDPGGQVTRRSGLRLVNEGDTGPSNDNRDGAIWITGTSGKVIGAFKAGILLTDEMGSKGIKTDGYFVHDGGDTGHRLDTFINCPNVTLATNIFNFPNFVVSAAGNVRAITLAGGAAANSSLGLYSTSGAGTSDAIVFYTGSQVERGRLTTGGLWRLGGAGTPSNAILTVTKNTASLPAEASATLQIGGADGAEADLTLDSFGTGTFTAFSDIMMRRANGTAASPSAIQSGDLIGRVGASGYGSTGYASVTRGQFRFFAAETWTDSAQGTSFSVFTTPTGGTSTTEALTVYASGGVTVGASIPDPGINNLRLGGALASAVPVTMTGTSGTVGASDSSIIVNSSGTFTITLPAAATYPGRWLTIKTIVANAVNSASSNVVPQISDTAGTAILTAVDGRWAILQSNGTNWVIMANGSP